MAKIYVVGHKKPDTDATVSPIIAAWYLGLKDKENEYIPVLQEMPNKEALFVLEYFDVEMPEIKSEFKPGDKVVIVDTTNPAQLPDLTDVEIIKIFDHHKLAGLTTNKPVEALIMPLGSTATVLFKYFKNNRLGCKNLDEKIAGLMLAAILSDTLNLKSPTTTDFDKSSLKKLAQIAGVNDTDALADKMFEAKSSLEGLSYKDIIKYDAKVFDFGDNNILIGVFETVKPEKLFDLYDKLVDAVKKIKQEENYDYVFFFVVDILNQTGYYLVLNDKEDEIIKKGYSVEFDKDSMFVELSGVVSRKKQIAPVIEKVTRN